MPQLTAPSSRRASASAPSGETLPGAPLKLAPLDPGAGPVYFRADRMQGVSEKFVEAEGHVELRTRRETVRADWLHYDLVADDASLVYNSGCKALI